MDDIPSSTVSSLRQQLVTSGNKLLICPACNKLNEVDESATNFTCPQCETFVEYRQCPRCRGNLNFIGDTRESLKLKCPPCGYHGKPSKFKAFSPGSADLDGIRDFYIRIGVDPDKALACAVFPGRTLVRGAILSTERLSGLTSGECTIEFSNDLVFVILGTLENTIMVPFQKVRNISFSGRGAVTTTTRTGGGFFGGGIGSISSMGEGMLLARAMNALSTKTVSTTTKETIITLEWDSGGVALINTQFVPLELAGQCQHIIDRMTDIEKSRSETFEATTNEMKLDTAPNLIEQLERLAALHQSGALTDKEFTAAKAGLMSP